MKKKSLIFWVAICCGVVGIAQALCKSFGVDLPMNILIDCISIVLCVLCCFGVLKNDTGRSDEEIKDIIADKLSADKEDLEVEKKKDKTSE
jgi:uncharacterized membrane protein